MHEWLSGTVPLSSLFTWAYCTWRCSHHCDLLFYLIKQLITLWKFTIDCAVHLFVYRLSLTKGLKGESFLFPSFLVQRQGQIFYQMQATTYLLILTTNPPSVWSPLIKCLISNNMLYSAYLLPFIFFFFDCISDVRVGWIDEHLPLPTREGTGWTGAQFPTPDTNTTAAPQSAIWIRHSCDAQFLFRFRIYLCHCQSSL